jgi:hypothetical protein
MKKLCFILPLVVVAHISNAQLQDTKWTGILQLESPVEVVFDFKTDTLNAINNSDKTVIESMTYKATDSTFTVMKVSGQSECDNVPGTYRYSIRDNELTIAKLNDDCSDRYEVLNNTKFKRQ